MKKKLLILDHNFKDYQGHHFNYNKYLDKQFKNKYDLEFYFNSNINKNIEKKFSGTVNKFFSDINNSISLKDKFLEFLKLLFKKIPFIRKIYYFFLKKNQFILNFSLKYLVKKRDKSSFLKKLYDIDLNNNNANIFIHSLTIEDFLDLINFENQLKNKNHFWIVYRRDPRDLKNYYNYISNIFSKNNFHLLTDSYKIKKFFEKKNINTQLINIPIFFEKKQKIRSNRSGKMTIAYLGDARFEKGFFELPAILSEIKNNYNFVIQANSNGYDSEEYKKTIQKLKNKKNLKLIYNQLSEKDYEKFIFKIDIILLPYKKENYKFRTSGIFFEGISANKIVIVTSDTWMASFYERNPTLKKLILNNKNQINEILNYINCNKNILKKEIKKIKKKISIIQEKKNIKKIFSNKNNIVNYKKKSLTYLIDDYTINRNKDGNQWGSSFLFKQILSVIKKKQFDKNLNILFNSYNISLQNQLEVKNSFCKNFVKDYFNISVSEGTRFFNLKNTDLEFYNYFDPNQIDISNLIIVNFHYFNELIRRLTILQRQKIIIFIHDKYNSINGQNDSLIDNDNLYYVFVSLKEFNKSTFKKAKKYLLYPHNFSSKNNNNLYKKREYKYYFVSSGSEIDVENLLKFLKLRKINNKINIIGEINNKKNKFDQYSNKLNFLGFVNNIEKIYNDNSSVFLIPRYRGTGIPIKFLEAIKHNSKCLLFGNLDNFGLPKKEISNIFVKNNYNNLNKIVNSINYKKNYFLIKNLIISNNNLNLIRLKKEINFK